MTAGSLKSGTPAQEAFSIAAASPEEEQVLLRRAIVIRHGETAWTLTGQHTGRTDLPLTENGRQTARRLAPLAAKESFARVLTSPLGRARETCELAGLGARAEVDEDLIEWNYGDYEGLTSSEIAAGRRAGCCSATGLPGGRKPAGLAGRVDRIIAQIRASRETLRCSGTATSSGCSLHGGSGCRPWRGPVPARHRDAERAQPLSRHPALKGWNAPWRF